MLALVAVMAVMVMLVIIIMQLTLMNFLNQQLKVRKEILVVAVPAVAVAVAVAALEHIIMRFYGQKRLKSLVIPEDMVVVVVWAVMEENLVAVVVGLSVFIAIIQKLPLYGMWTMF